MRKNSWALVIEGKKVKIFAGAGVERGDDFLAEGAWAGDFSSSGLLSSTFRCASGAVFTDDAIILVGPSHSVEGIYYFQTAGGGIASNSMQLILALMPDADPGKIYNHVGALHTVVTQGVNYRSEIYSTAAGTMMRFAFDTMTLRPGPGEKPQVNARRTSRFQGYDEYYQLLLSTLAGLLANARDSRRRQPYGSLVTTCSSGYDSTACAALASAFQCDLVLTIRSGRGGRIDSGVPVAEALGIAYHELDRPLSSLEHVNERNMSVLNAQHVGGEFRDLLASPNTSQDIPFAPFEPFLENAILLTGFHGDKAWNIKCSSGPDIIRGDSSGSGLDEFRKRLGFVNVPVPYIGVDNYAELSRISKSEEMASYRVGGGYDRPIPRRIAEDAGVPRHAFGTKKSAAATLLQGAGQLRTDAFYQVVNEYRQSLAAMTPDAIQLI